MKAVKAPTAPNTRQGTWSSRRGAASTPWGGGVSSTSSSSAMAGLVVPSFVAGLGVPGLVVAGMHLVEHRTVGADGWQRLVEVLRWRRRAGGPFEGERLPRVVADRRTALLPQR